MSEDAAHAFHPATASDLPGDSLHVAATPALSTPGPTRSPATAGHALHSAGDDEPTRGHAFRAHSRLLTAVLDEPEPRDAAATKAQPPATHADAQAHGEAGAAAMPSPSRVNPDLRFQPTHVASIRRRLRDAASGSTPLGRRDIATLFRALDANSNGTLEWEEFRAGVRKYGRVLPGSVSDAELYQVFQFVDLNDNGVMSVEEFKWFMSAPDERLFGAPPTAAASVSRRGSPTASPGTSPPPGGPPCRPLRWNKRALDTMKQRLHASAYAVGGVQWPKLLARMDSSGTGALEWADFKRGIRAELHASPRDVPDADARRIFCFVDKACTGVVEVGELATFISGGPVDDGLGFYDGASGGGDSDGDDSPFGANHKAATPKARRDVAHHVTFAPTANDEAAAAAPAAAASGQADGADASGGAATPGNVRFDAALLARVRRQLVASAFAVGGVNFHNWFDRYGRNANGALLWSEFRKAVRRDGKITAAMVSDRDLRRVFRFVDTHDSGCIDAAEFDAFMREPDHRLFGTEACGGASAAGDEVVPPRRQLTWDDAFASHVAGRLRDAAHTADGERVLWPDLFRRLDRDGSGELDWDEFRHGLRHEACLSTADFSTSDLRRLFCLMDTDCSGTISLAELEGFVTDHGTKGLAAELAAAAAAKPKRGGRRGVFASATVRRVKQKLRAAAYTAGGVNYRKLFKHYDRDNSGGLECDEFISAIRRDAKIPKREVSDRELAAVFSAVDDDGGGTVDIEEFVTWLEADGAGIAASPQRPAKSPAPAVGATHRGGSGGDGDGELATTPASKGAASTPGSNGTPHSARRSASRSPSRQRIAHTRSGRSRSRGKSRKPRVRGESMNAAKVRKVKQKLRAAAYTAGGVDFAKLFKHYDRDNSGSLECDEFINAIRRDAKIAKREVSDKDLEGVFAIVDEDGGGSIDVDEFVTWLDAPDVSSLKDRRAKKKSPHAAKRHRAKPKAIDSRLRRFDPSRLAMVRHHLRREAQRAGDLDYSQLFRVYDTDGSGNLEWREFRSAIRHAAGIGEDKLSEADLRLLFRYVDLNDNGLVDVDEFETFLWIAEEEELFGPDASAAGGAGAGGAGGDAGANADADAADRAQAALRRPLQWDPKGVEMVKRRLRSAAYVAGGVQWAKLFRNMDSDGSGHLEWPEFLSGMRKHAKLAPRDIPDRDLRRMFMYVDRDCSGAVSVRELAAFVSEGMSLAKRTKSWTGRAPATAPRNVAVTVLRDRLVVTWDEPEDCGGSDVQSYTIHAEPLHNPPPPRLKGACPYANSHGAWVTSAVTPRSEVLTVVVDDDLMAEITHHKKNCWCVRVMLCGCVQDPDIACCVVVAFVAQVSTSCCSTQ